MIPTSLTNMEENIYEEILEEDDYSCKPYPGILSTGSWKQATEESVEVILFDVEAVGS